MSCPGGICQQKKEQALAAKNTAVLTYDELERIKEMCKQTTTNEDYQTMRNRERQNLQKLSSTRVQAWPNTIQAERDRKEKDRIKKLEE